ncbi:hypothetical protein Leryth_006477 [Lithospermum erythrorhizon]|nr:hypothetical protein Leryth_006477 [Lithospermum erythrorhizon]
MTLLQQDGKLPEDSIQDIAYGLVTALQFLHSKGIIYCDLKPSNLLLDENGLIKLCDFGLSRKLDDISKIPSTELPQAKRGTPCYMAPELFQDGGVHSYASDLWALGCVLYECYCGRPPFVAREFTQLVKSIISDPIPVIPGSPTLPFVNLVNSLLIKDPAERIQWGELCEHAFWKSKLPPLPLPPQPAFLDMLELASKPYLSERNGDKPVQNKTPSKISGRDPKRPLKQDENSNVISRGHETPLQSASAGRRTQTKPTGRPLDSKQKDNSAYARGFNLMRLSRIAKSNLKRENEKENYRRPLPNSSDNDGEVHIENNDMELDFNENNTEEDTPDDVDGSDNLLTTPESSSAPDQREETEDEIDNTANNMNVTPMVAYPPLDGPKILDGEKSTEQVEAPATPPRVSPHVKTASEMGDSAPRTEGDISKLSTNLSQVFWHPSDLSVRPVMPVKKSDRTLDAVTSVPFGALPAADFAKMPKEQLDSICNKIISIIAGNTTIAEKQNVIKYLEVLSTNCDAANILTNGPIILLLVKLLRQSKASALRAQLASLIGLLIRHSTYISDELANSGMLGALTDGLRDRQEKVRRFSMAALGELLFYISTQNEQGKEGNLLESPSKENRQTSGWQVPSSVITLVASVLRHGEDDITQLYALRTIENISSQGGYWATRFSSQDVISNLSYIFRAAGKQESTRLTAGSCLVRLVRFNLPTIQRVVDKIQLKDIASSLTKGSSREQQICLNLLNMAVLVSPTSKNIGKSLLQLVEDKNVVTNIVSLLEKGSDILRGKALVFVALLCKNGNRWLAQFFCNARFLSTVDRLLKEKDNFLQQCLDAFTYAITLVVPDLLETLSVDIQQLMSGKRRGLVAALASRGSPKTNIHLFPVVLHLLQSSLFKHRVVTPRILQQLANLLKLVEAPFQGRDDFQITLLQVFESIAEDHSIINDSHDMFIHHIIPSLAVLYKGNKDGDARFLCLKVLFDIMVFFLNDTSETGQLLTDLKSVSNTCFLPLYPSLIEDDDPIPVYAQKLLVMLIDLKYIRIQDIVHMKTVPQCFGFLFGDFSAANVNNVMLCLALASADELETKMLSQLKVVRKIGNLLEFAWAREMEDFIEPTLGLCRTFLLRAVGHNEGVSYAKDPALLNDSSDNAGVIEQHGYIEDITDFGDNVGVLLELIRCTEASFADLASECLVLLFRTAPREATTGFLSKLPITTSILESHVGFSHLVVQRLLHAFCFSCRYYLAQAMILPICIPEIAKIELIVSKIKSSNVQAVADAASRLALELQRLPRRI